MQTINCKSLFYLVLVASGYLLTTSVSAQPPVSAHAVIQGCADAGAITGKAELRERRSDEGIKQVEVMLRVRGLADGAHAVHIHETGKCMPCGSAGGHFDPGPFGMTNPDANHPFHSGDLVNLSSRKGMGTLKTLTTRITLSPGPLSLFDADGSAFIIHTNKDTYCTDGEVAGCAGGSREACGVIVMDQ